MNNTLSYQYPNQNFDILQKFKAMPGDRLRVKHWWGEHVGTMGYGGIIYANSLRYGKICKVTPLEFSDGKHIVNDGLIGHFPSQSVILRWESLMGRPYDLLSFNCEHSDNLVRGFGAKSNQVRDLVIGFAILAGAAALIKR